MKPIAECEVSVKTTDETDLCVAEVRVCAAEDQVLLTVETIDDPAVPNVVMFLDLEDSMLLSVQLEEAIRVANGELSRTTGGYSRLQPSGGYSGFVPHARPTRRAAAVAPSGKESV